MGIDNKTKRGSVNELKPKLEIDTEVANRKGLTERLEIRKKYTKGTKLK